MKVLALPWKWLGNRAARRNADRSPEKDLKTVFSIGTFVLNTLKRKLSGFSLTKS